jgi:6-phosphogluconolactonase/glucosamine-6-phosphate isomerase/deaminase
LTTKEKERVTTSEKEAVTKIVATTPITTTMSAQHQLLSTTGEKKLNTMHNNYISTSPSAMTTSKPLQSETNVCIN